MWQIIPVTHENYDALNPRRISDTYLHGKLQDDAFHDLFGFINCEIPCNESNYYVEESYLTEGKYPCFYRNRECIYPDKECILYLWRCNSKHMHGLVVYIDDLESIEYAEKCFNKKEKHI